MLVKLKKSIKVRNSEVSKGTVLDIHYKKAMELIKNGTAEIEILKAETV